VKHTVMCKCQETFQFLVGIGVHRTVMRSQQPCNYSVIHAPLITWSIVVYHRVINVLFRADRLNFRRRGFAPGFVNYKKWCTGLAAASDKVYQLLAHGRWFSQGTAASSTTKTGRHAIAEILLKVALKHKKSIIKHQTLEIIFL